MAKRQHDVATGMDTILDEIRNLAGFQIEASKTIQTAYQIPTATSLPAAEVASNVYQEPLSVGNAARSAGDDQQPLLPGSNVNSAQREEVPIQLNFLQSKTCAYSYSCACHKHSTTKWTMSRILGRLFIGYSNCPGAFQTCTRTTCDYQPHIDVEVTYMFPKWLLSRVFRLKIISSRVHEPCVSLTVRNLLPRFHPWFEAVRKNDCSKLRDLIKECPSRVNDVDEAGRTAALVSLISLQLSTRSHWRKYPLHSLQWGQLGRFGQLYFLSRDKLISSRSVSKGLGFYRLAECWIHH